MVSLSLGPVTPATVTLFPLSKKTMLSVPSPRIAGSPRLALAVRGLQRHASLEARIVVPASRYGSDPLVFGDQQASDSSFRHCPNSGDEFRLQALNLKGGLGELGEMIPSLLRSGWHVSRVVAIRN